MKGPLSSEQLMSPFFLQFYCVQQVCFEFVVLYLEIDTSVCIEDQSPTVTDFKLNY